jgi:hypothetical protein
MPRLPAGKWNAKETGGGQCQIGYVLNAKTSRILLPYRMEEHFTGLAGGQKVRIADVHVKCKDAWLTANGGADFAGLQDKKCR